MLHKHHNKPTYKTKTSAERHGYLTYGKTKTGARKFRVDAVRSGWNVSRRKF